MYGENIDMRKLMLPYRTYKSLKLLKIIAKTKLYT